MMSKRLEPQSHVGESKWDGRAAFLSLFAQQIPVRLFGPGCVALLQLWSLPKEEIAEEFVSLGAGALGALSCMAGNRVATDALF